MSKLLSVLMTAILLLGIAIYIFNGNGGVKDTVIDGHDRVTDKLRTFDYRSN